MLSNYQKELSSTHNNSTSILTNSHVIGSNQSIEKGVLGEDEPCNVCEEERRLAEVYAHESNTENENETPTLSTEINEQAYKAIRLDLSSLSILLASVERALRSELYFEEEEEPKKVEVKKASKRKPAIGVLGGWSSPERYSEVEEYNNEFVKKNAWEAGLYFSYPISPQFNAWTSIALQKSQYRTNTLDTIWGYAPLENFPTNSFDYLNGSIQQQQIRYHIGINYQFLKNTNWHPCIGLSLAAQSNLKQDIFLTYREGEAGTYVEEEVDLMESFNDSSFKIQALVPSIGLKWYLNKHIYWQGEAWYQHAIRKRATQMYMPVGFRGSIGYQF